MPTGEMDCLKRPDCHVAIASRNDERDNRKGLNGNMPYPRRVEKGAYAILRRWAGERPIGPLAQLAEHRTFNPGVVGSIPTRPTNAHPRSDAKEPRLPMTALHCSITIRADRETVWRVLIDDGAFREWASNFAEGAGAEGDWSEGSRVRFLTPGGDGMVSVVAENRPAEPLSIKHQGEMSPGRGRCRQRSSARGRPLSRITRSDTSLAVPNCRSIWTRFPSAGISSTRLARQPGTPSGESPKAVGARPANPAEIVRCA